jgi:HlyD family secretion protein
MKQLAGPSQAVPFDDMGSMRRHMVLGAAAMCLLVFGFGGWAMTTEFSGAVISSGQLVVRSEVKKVQHPTGGVVGELAVREGSVVSAGQLLLKLDDTMARSSLSIISASLDEARAQQARNLAEREEANEIAFPRDLLDRADNATVAALLDGERKLFQTRRDARAGQNLRLREQVAQGEQQIAGLQEQITAKTREYALIERELAGVRDLFKRQLISVQRLTMLEREMARIGGERGQLTASTSIVRGRMAETELQILQINRDMRNETGRELAELRAKITELIERRVAAEDILRRIEIRSPQDGTVTQLTVNAPGAVVNPNAEAIMLIVPRNDDLVVESKVSPTDIDQVYVGQGAVIRFPAFSQRTTPEIRGAVALVSPDVRRDPRTGAPYYLARVDIPSDQLSRIGSVALIPGMPADVFIQTQPRTVASFLLRPLTDNLTRMFRER